MSRTLVCTCALTFALPANAHDAEAPRCDVVVVSDEGDVFGELVAEELRANVSCIAVAQSIEDARHRTIVRVVSRRSVEIWEQGALSTVLMLTGSDDVDAIKVAEHVHARTLAPVEPLPPQMADVVTPLVESPRPPSAESPPIRAAAPPADRVLLGAGIGGSLEGTSIATTVRLDARARLAGPLGAGALVSLPLAPGRLTQGGHEAVVATVAGGVYADALLGHPARGFSFRGGVATLLARTSTSGFTTAPLEGRRDARLTVVIGALASMALALTERFAVTVDGLIGAAVPGVEIRFAGERAASWGAPFALLSLGGRIAF